MTKSLYISAFRRGLAVLVSLALLEPAFPRGASAVMVPPRASLITAAFDQEAFAGRLLHVLNPIADPSPKVTANLSISHGGVMVPPSELGNTPRGAPHSALGLGERRVHRPLFPMVLDSDNGNASIIVNEHGAQLSSLVVGKKEVLSNGENSWGGVTVVGPWVGRAKNGFVPSSTGESAYVGDSPYVQMLEGHALNGMLMRMKWKVDEDGPASRRHAVRLIPEDSSQMEEAYGGLHPTLTYEMMDHGVAMGWEITNRGKTPVHASFGFHPVFDTPEGEGWTLTLSASHHITTLVPTDGLSEPVAGTDYDLHAPKALDGVHWDFGLTGFSPGIVTATLQNRAGRKIELSWNASEFPVAWIWVEHGHAAIEPFMSWPNLQKAPLFEPHRTVRAFVTLRAMTAPQKELVDVPEIPPASTEWEDHRNQALVALIHRVQRMRKDPSTPPNLVRLAAMFEHLYPKLPAFADRFLEEYFELSKKHGMHPGEVRLVLCNVRADAPLRMNTDIDLKFVVDDPGHSLYPLSLRHSDPIHDEMTTHLIKAVERISGELGIPYQTPKSPFDIVSFAEPLSQFGPEGAPNSVILAMGQLRAPEPSESPRLTLPQTYDSGASHFKGSRKQYQQALDMLGALGEMDRLKSLYGENPQTLAHMTLRRAIELFYAPDHESELLSDPNPLHRRQFARAHGHPNLEAVVETIYAAIHLEFEEAEEFLSQWSGAGLGYRLAIELVKDAFDEAKEGNREKGQKAVGKWSHFLHNLLNPAKVLTLGEMFEARTVRSRRSREYERSRDFIELLKQAIRKGWTQGQLADRIGLHQGNISRMIREKELPYESTIREFEPKLLQAIQEEPPRHWHFRSQHRSSSRALFVSA